MGLFGFFSKMLSERCNSKDPIDYNSTTRRLFRTEQNYCVYSAGSCITTTVGYNSTTRRLFKMNTTTTQGQRCPNYVDYDSSTRRLKVYLGTACGVT